VLARSESVLRDKRLNGLLGAGGAAAIAVWLLPANVLAHDEGPTTTVLFSREIVHILDDHCVACHADHALAFPLASYEDVYARAQAIKTAVLRRHMPPWSAVAAYGDFDNDNHLTRREIDFIVSWLNGGAPRNRECAPQNRTLSLADCEAAARQQNPETQADPHFGRWRHGQPDFERTLPPFTTHAGVTSTKIVFDLGLSTSQRVAAWEYRPDDRGVTQAVTFTLESTGQWLGTWTPWRSFFVLPAGAAYVLGPETRIVAEVYHVGVEKRVNGGTLGLSFAGARTAAHEPKDITIELHGATERLSADATLPSDVEALAVWLEPPLDARAVDLFGVLPDGTTKVLLALRNQGFDWPTPYVFKSPVSLPKGTRLTVVAKGGARRLPPSGHKVIVCAVDTLARPAR
jgi:hypothetical protein